MTTIVSAVIAGAAVLLAGNLPWVALLAPLNLRFVPSVPWAIVPMAIYLVLYWRYISGRIGSRESADRRRTDLRANALGPDEWLLAIVTGLVGFAGLLALVAVMARLIDLPQSPPITAPRGMPTVTVLLLLMMSAIVAGVTEEAGFRGYMQGPIERRYGLTLGILVNGVMFGLLHFPNHPGAVMSMLPYYIAVAAVYGGVSWAANSILPAIVLHVGGDIWSLTRLWTTGRPEWQLATTPPQFLSETGVDASFVVTTASVILFGSAFIALCGVLRRSVAAVTGRPAEGEVKIIPAAGSAGSGNRPDW
jgi:membrane protease YdiL (CAAX protease family)